MLCWLVGLDCGTNWPYVRVLRGQGDAGLHVTGVGWEQMLKIRCTKNSAANQAEREFVRKTLAFFFKANDSSRTIIFPAYPN